MRLGATLAYLSPAPPFAIGERARHLADAGFDSLWVPQVVGRGFWVADPFVTLTAAALATDGVELGTATLQVPLHHPADLAHRILSLSAVCGSRLAVGLSPGSTAIDYATFGRDHASRFAVFDEHVARLRVLLREGRDDGAQLAPAGLIDVPPLLLGSWGARVEQAAAEFDGWLASGYRTLPDDVIAAHQRYRAAGGRRAIVCALPIRSAEDLGPTGELLHRFAEAGLDDVVVLIEPGGPAPERVRALFP